MGHWIALVGRPFEIARIIFRETRIADKRQNGLGACLFFSVEIPTQFSRDNYLIVIFRPVSRRRVVNIGTRVFPRWVGVGVK